MRQKTRLLVTAAIWALCVTSMCAQTIILKRETPGEKRVRELNSMLGGRSLSTSAYLAKQKRLKAMQDAAITCLPLSRGWQFRVECSTRSMYFGDAGKAYIKKATLVKIGPEHVWFIQGNYPKSKVKQLDLNKIPLLIKDKNSLPYNQQVLIWKRVNLAMRVDPKVGEKIKKEWPKEALKKPVNPRSRNK